MRAPRRPAMFGRRFIGHLRRLIGIYWTSPGARRGILLLAGAVFLELGTVYGNLRLADAERRIMDAVQDKQSAAFFAASRDGLRRGGARREPDAARDTSMGLPL